MIKERVYFLIIWYDANSEERINRICRRHVDPEEERDKLFRTGTQLIDHWRIKEIEIVDAKNNNG